MRVGRVRIGKASPCWALPSSEWGGGEKLVSPCLHLASPLWHLVSPGHDGSTPRKLSPLPQCMYVYVCIITSCVSSASPGNAVKFLHSFFSLDHWSVGYRFLQMGCLVTQEDKCLRHSRPGIVWVHAFNYINTYMYFFGEHLLMNTLCSENTSIWWILLLRLVQVDGGWTKNVEIGFGILGFFFVPGSHSLYIYYACYREVIWRLWQ